MSDSEDDMDLDKEIKISLVGESGTGKSMLCARYLGRAQCGATQGADVLMGQCPLAQGGFGRDLGFTRGPQLRLCDISGHGRDAPMLRNYLYASNVIIFVYDITNLQSFELLAMWLERVIEVASRDKYLPVVALFGNKSDLEHQRAIRVSSVLKFASDNKMLNYFGSARTGDGVFGAFMSLIAHVMGVPIGRSLPNSRAPKADTAITDKQPSKTSVPNSATKKSLEVKEVPLILERKKMMEIKRKAVSAYVCECVPPRPARDAYRPPPDLLATPSQPSPAPFLFAITLIEKYTENVRFCIICNYLSRIIPALQSRCTRFRFAPLQPSQITPRLQQVVDAENVKITPDGIKALLSLSGGDMRKILNTLQSTWLAYKNVTEDNVYTCVGHPLAIDIATIVSWLLNEDDFAMCYRNIQNLKTSKGLALSDILTEIHQYIHRTELPSDVLITLLIKMSDMEQRLSTGCTDSTQLASLIASFQIARDLVTPSSS